MDHAPDMTTMVDAGAMEQACLAGDLHAALLGQDLVLLDLTNDEYLCLPDCGVVSVEGAVVRGSLETLLRLSSEELLHSGPDYQRPCPPVLPLTALPPLNRGRPRLGDRVRFAAIWVDAVRTRPSLQDLRRRMAGRRGRRDDLEAIAARVEIFRQILPWAPWTGACLLQAELMLRFLNAAGLDADWVVGVRTWPFLAHCWLQVGDVCISEPPETLTHYRPILAL